MQKIILDTIKQFRETYYGSTCGGDGLFNSELFRDLEDFLKQALTKMYEAGIKQEKINTGRIKKRQYENGFKAGQKSREKEIVEISKKGDKTL